MKKCEEGLAGIKRRGLVLIVSRAATPYPEKERPRRSGCCTTLILKNQDLQSN